MLLLPGIDSSYWTGFFPGILVMALGMAVSVAPLTTVVMTAVPDRQAGIASGVNNAVSRAAALVALAVFGALVYGIFHGEMIDAVAALGVSDANAARVLSGTINLAAMDIPADLPASMQEALSGAVKSAFVAAFRWAMGLAAVLSILSVFGAVLWIDGKPEALDQRHPVPTLP